MGDAAQQGGLQQDQRASDIDLGRHRERICQDYAVGVNERGVGGEYNLHRFLVRSAVDQGVAQQDDRRVDGNLPAARAAGFGGELAVGDQHLPILSDQADVSLSTVLRRK